MPKPLFYSISEEKRQRFIEGVYRQFTTRKYADITISSIAREVGISRGTVYNYFDTVGDILEYLITDIQDMRSSYLTKFYQTSNYDIFQTFIKLFEYEFDQFVETKKYSIIQHYLTYLHQEHKSFQDGIVQRIFQPLLKSSGQPLYDPTRYRVTKDQFFQSIEMILSLVVKLFDEVELQQFSKQEAIERFHYIMDVFQHGMMQQT